MKMLQVDFHGYEKLPREKAVRSRRFWKKKMNGRGKGLKLAGSRRKVSWKPFAIMFVLSRKIVRKYLDFVKRVKMEEVCPAIVFSCQWGLPVLSHAAQNSRRSSYSSGSCRRSLTWVQSQCVQG